MTREKTTSKIAIREKPQVNNKLILNPLSISTVGACPEILVFDSLCSILPTMVQAQIACIRSTAERSNVW